MKTDYHPHANPAFERHLFELELITLIPKIPSPPEPHYLPIMAGNKRTDGKASKAGDKSSSKSKGGSNKDDKAGDASSSKLKPATSINTRHILVHPISWIHLRSMLTKTC